MIEFVTLRADTFIQVKICRWVDDEPQPGIVECRFTDAIGREWTFIEKSAVVSAEDLAAKSNYPQPGVIACEVISRGRDDAGREIVEISTDKPWGIEATDGTTVFSVFAEQLIQKNSN